MKVLVCGGAGFIGTNVCLEAVKRGHEVVAFDNLNRHGVNKNRDFLIGKQVRTIIGNVIRFKEYLKEEDDFDAIIHLAGNPGIPFSLEKPVSDFFANAVGTLNVLEYARTHGNIPVIFASTNKTYSDLINEIPLIEKETRYEWKHNDDFLEYVVGWSDAGINESFLTEGLGRYAHSPYGISKLTADHYCQEYYLTFGVPTVINRMSCIYGLYQQGVADQGWIDHFVRQSFVENPHLDIYGDGKQVRDMLWGGDVANLYLDELENIDFVKGEVFNVGGGISNTLSLLEAITIIEEISGKKFSLDYHPWRVADQKIYVADTSKVTTTLEWKPIISPKEGIKLMYERYKNDGL